MDDKENELRRDGSADEPQKGEPVRPLDQELVFYCIASRFQFIAEAAAFVATAVASGVLGNAAYDKLKASLAEFRNTGSIYRTSSNRFLHQRKERELLARLAVQARLAELGLPVPRFELLQVTSAKASSAGHDLQVTSDGLTGIVHIPGGEPDGSRVLVDILTVVAERPNLREGWLLD